MNFPPIKSPVSVSHTEVPREWIDGNGHMSASFYNDAFRIPMNALFEHLQLGMNSRDGDGTGIFMLDWRVQYVNEVLEGMSLDFEARLLDVSDKVVHYYMEMFAGEERYLAASCEVVEIQVDRTTRRTRAFDAETQQHLDAMLVAHNKLPPPQRAGQPFGIRRRTAP